MSSASVSHSYTNTTSLPVVISLFPPQVRSLGGGCPEYVVVLLQVPCKEQVTAEEGDVFGHVAHRDVQIATLFHHGLQKQQKQVTRTE